jgi:hypothetical protein
MAPSRSEPLRYPQNPTTPRDAYLRTYLSQAGMDPILGAFHRELCACS